MGRIKSATIFSLIIFAIAAAGLPSCGGKSGSFLDKYEWVMVDETFIPTNDVETFIKTDAENRGIIPVYIKNYGSNEKALNLFKGNQYARPGRNTLEMLNQGLDNWMLVDIRYKAENEREVIRTVLYLSIQGRWKVGDSGTLITS